MSILARPSYLFDRLQGSERVLKPKQQIILERYHPNDLAEKGYIRYIEVLSEMRIQVLHWIDHAEEPVLEKELLREEINRENLMSDPSCSTAFVRISYRE